jgi:hypothetical protein
MKLIDGRPVGSFFLHYYWNYGRPTTTNPFYFSIHHDGNISLRSTEPKFTPTTAFQ